MESEGGRAMSTRNRSKTASRRIRVRLNEQRRRNFRPQGECLEDRAMLAIDFGDAPDLGGGAGAGDYQTLLANNGPRHTIVAGMRMGANVDGETDAFPNARANGDDVNQA